MRGGGKLTACVTQGESLDLNILCVRLWGGWGCGETEKSVHKRTLQTKTVERKQETKEMKELR